MSDGLLASLRQPALPFDGWESWWSRFVLHLDPALSPAAQAWLGGALATGPEQAFLAAYQVALGALLGMPPIRLRAFAAAEGPGTSLRRPATQLAAGPGGGLELRGRKSFVTLPECLDECLVLASRVPGEDCRETVVVRLDRNQIGASLTATGLVPAGFRDLRFGRLTFDGLPVAAEAVLPGPGHEDYSRRFRWLEDHLVLIALLGWLLRTLLSDQAGGWTRGQLRDDAETLLLLARALSAQASAGGDEVSAVLTFAGARSRLGDLLEKWRSLVAPGSALHAGLPVLEGLLAVAVVAQAKRREKAWSRVQGPEN